MKLIKLVALAIILISSMVIAVSVLAGNNKITNQVKAKGETGLFTIEVRDAEIQDVLRALAQQAGMNFIIGERVEGKVTFSLQGIPLKDALEVILKAYGLGYVIQHNVLWIGKREDIAKLGEDLTMEIIQLNYAKAADVVPQIKGVLSERGSVTPDARTNILIMRDIKKNIEEAKKLLVSLDTRTQQVIIEARIVEANSNFSRQLGIQWGGQYTSDSGKNIITGSSRLPTSPGGRSFAVNLPVVGATGGLGLVIGSLKSNLLLDVELTAAEKKGQLKIISQPKVTTLNNKPATIHSGLTFKVRTTTTTATTTGTTTGTATTGTTLQEIKTGIDLTVTPQISTDDFVLLAITASKSDPDFGKAIDGIPGVTEKSASTSVLVKDGETTVIGGLYRSSSSSTNDSVPYLSTIPLLGWFFKSQGQAIDNEELLIFITPRIVRYSKVEAN
ncbi:MAG: type IV pilus secretin PilQ [Deltaproteobacteria bacterium]|nr:type IV pilus secretin PilQ [Deltaproteobacteria bacterium]